MANLSYLNRIREGHAPSEFATCGCLHPQKVCIVDCLGTPRTIVTDCGRCIRCSDARRNEMAARMFLHGYSNDEQTIKSPWRFCYFVTLTYGSYNLNNFEQHPFKKDWLATHPILTDFNKCKRMAWTPTLLRRSHVVKYLKRLRKLVGDTTISYCYCGEYGSNYFRPHFHLVIWSDKAVDSLTFQRAWSLLIAESASLGPRKSFAPYRNADFQKPIRWYIGHVRVDDLVQNGSTNYRSTCKDGDTHNAMHNFMYVAKYLGKQYQVVPEMESRFIRAFFSMEHYHLDEDGERAFVDKSRGDGEFFQDDYVDVDMFLREKIDYVNLNQNQRLALNTTVNFINNGIQYTNINYNEFKQIFSPFFGSSRKYAIGKQFALQNKQRLAEGAATLPQFRGKSISYPKYFSYLLQKEFYPIRLAKKTTTGVSLSKNNLPHLYMLFDKFAEDKNVFYALSTGASYAHVKEEFRALVYSKKDSSDLSLAYHSLGHQFQSLFNCLVFTYGDGTYHYEYSPLYDVYIEYEFNRSSGLYEYSDFIERQTFCHQVCELIDVEISRLKSLEWRYEEALTLFDAIESDPDSATAREDFTKFRENLSQKYHDKHIDIN